MSDETYEQQLDYLDRSFKKYNIDMSVRVEDSCRNPSYVLCEYVTVLTDEEFCKAKPIAIRCKNCGILKKRIMPLKQKLGFGSA